MSLPTLMTSIIPFGKVSDGSSAFERFSLCIDLKPTAEGDNSADTTAYKNLLSSYGRGGNSIYEHLLNSLSAEIGPVFIILGHATKATTIKCSPCFPGEFNAVSVAKRWDLLLGPAEQVARQMSVPDVILTKSGTTSADPPARINFELFRDFEDPTVIQRKLVASQQRLNQNGVATADQNAIVSEIKTASDEVINNLERTNQLFRGMNDFAYAQNERQSKARRDNGFRARLAQTGIFYSPETIIEIFSFINSDPILQRLFGTTIDFQIPAGELRKILPLGLTGFGGEFTAKLAAFSGGPLVGSLDWKHHESRLMYHTDGRLGSLVLMAANSLNKQYVAESYDRGTVLKGMDALEENIGNIETALATAKTESDRYAINEKINKINSSARTTGMTLYHADPKAELKSIKDTVDNVVKGNSGTPLTEIDVRSGYRVGVVRQGRTDILSVGKRGLSVVDEKGASIVLPKEFNVLDSAVGQDAGANALVAPQGNGTGSLQHAIVISSALLSWVGENTGLPSMFSSHEDDASSDSTDADGSLAPETAIVTERFSEILREETLPTTVGYSDPYEKNGKLRGGEGKIVLSYRSLKSAETKLLYGETYRICLAPQYKNGWAPEFSCEDSGASTKLEPKLPQGSFTTFKFKRNEIVKPVELYLQDKLVDARFDAVTKRTTTSAAPDRQGESLHHLVVRNRSSESTDDPKRTQQKSVRYILPPAISFQQAFWHGKIFEMAPAESYDWYLRHHFPAVEGGPKRDRDGLIIKDKFYRADEVYTRSTSMREFFPEPWFTSDTSWIINYLPDPLLGGFRLEFFRDKDYRIKALEYEKYEQGEYYFTGTYPEIMAWKLILEDVWNETELVEQSGARTILVRLERGAELFIRVRTILADEYEDQFETFGNYNEYTKFGGNDILTPPLDISAVHATQRPLVTPRLRNTLESRKERQSETLLTMKHVLDFEQLCVFRNSSGAADFVPAVLPTGSIELYSKCEEYSDDPRRLPTPDRKGVEGWDPTKPINKVDLSRLESRTGETPGVFETDIKLTDSLEQIKASLNRTENHRSEMRNYSADISASYDCRSHHFVEKAFWVKNKSKFTGYFPANEDLEWFNKNSDEPFVVRFLNNKKPEPPSVADRNMTLVSTIDEVKVGRRTTRTIRLRRVRLYVNRGRLTSGKGERIGIVVNEPKSKYNDHFVATGQVSSTGRDIVSDRVKPFDAPSRNRQVLLNRSNFVIRDPVDLHIAPKDGFGVASDLESFFPQYVEELGLMTYLPKFDMALNLWYVDIELDINNDQGKELHNAFVKFGLVHYQQHSEIYGAAGNVHGDCRISNIEMSRFVYVMATRTIIYEELGNGKFTVKVVADPESVVSLKGTDLFTRFFAFAEERESGTFKWHPRKDPNGKDIIIELELGKAHEINIGAGSRRRITFLETEHRAKSSVVDDLPTSVSEVRDEKQQRIVLVNSFDPDSTS